jgi:hypothetical protein
MNLQAVVPSQVGEGLAADQFLAAVRWDALDLGNLAPDPGSFLCQECSNSLIPYMHWDSDLQITANDVERSSPSDGADHLYP